MSREEFMGLVRHVLTGLGLLLASRATQSTGPGWSEIIMGIGMFIAGAAWSVWEKRSRKGKS